MSLETGVKTAPFTTEAEGIVSLKRESTSSIWTTHPYELFLEGEKESVMLDLHERIFFEKVREGDYFRLLSGGQDRLLVGYNKENGFYTSRS